MLSSGSPIWIPVRTCSASRSITSMGHVRHGTKSVTRAAPSLLGWTVGGAARQVWIEWLVWIPLTSRARPPAPGVQRGEQCPLRRSPEAVVETVKDAVDSGEPSWTAWDARDGPPWPSRMRQDSMEVWDGFPSPHNPEVAGSNSAPATRRQRLLSRSPPAMSRPHSAPVPRRSRFPSMGGMAWRGSGGAADSPTWPS